MGYALPANTVRRLVISMYDSYVANGNTPISGTKTKWGIKKAILNITTEVTDSYARLDTNGFTVITELVKVSTVEGSPARGILEVGDIFVSAKLKSSDGTLKEDVTINRGYSLSEMLISARVNDTLTLKIARTNVKPDTTVEVSIKFGNGDFKYFE